MKIRLMLVLFLAVYSFADDFWTRTHYLGLGINGYLTTGDLKDDRSISLDEDSLSETFNLPVLEHSIIPEIEVGVNINAHSVGLLFGYNSFESDYSYFRIGVDYRYFLFWPEPFQLGFGLNYTYMRITSDDNVETTSTEKNDTVIGDGVLMGNGASAISSVRYYFTERWGAEFSLKYRLFFYSSLNTKECGTCGIDETQYQHFGEAGIKLFFQL